MKTKLIIGCVLLIALVAGVYFLPVKDWLIAALEWTEGLGVWGPFLVALFYIVACVFLLPGSVLTLGAGFVFKLLVGTITVSIGSTLGASAAFLLGRSIARNWIASKAAQNEKFTALDEAVGRQGFKIVFLTRLSPVIPFNLLNYAYSLTKVPFWEYALATWIGMLPVTVMYVYIGASLGSLAEAAAKRETIGAGERIFYWFGLAMTIAVTVFITHFASKTLKKAVSRQGQPGG